MSNVVSPMVQSLSLRKKQTKQALSSVEERIQHLAFGLGGETFGMEIRFVKEVLQCEALTVVPLLPGCIRGVINLRGAVVPVVDLSVRFQRPPTEVTKRTCIVILEIPRAGATVVVGIIVDNVSEVLELAPSEIESARGLGADARSEFIKGVGKVRNHFVILLDVHHLLSSGELAALAEVPESGALHVAPDKPMP